MVAGLLIASGDSDGTAGPALALRPVDAGGPASAGTARVVDAGGGTLRLRVDGLPPSDERRFYELWLMDEGGRNLVSLGTFRVPASGGATVEVPLPADPARYRYLDVSLEPADGDPGHSGDSVLRGATS